ncbi:hypothetical protein Btru_076354 [Bulinus truncatus]|nr:hypothetical protein Btru_076354 [Bulinus truncatus]
MPWNEKAKSLLQKRPSQAEVSNVWPAAGVTSHGTAPFVLPLHSIEPAGEYVQNTALPGTISFSRAPVTTVAPRLESDSTNPPYGDSVGHSPILYHSPGYPSGYYTYIQPEPAHLSHYGPRRTHISTPPGHRAQHSARTYYPAQQPIPMPTPGGAPPPPPPDGDSYVVNDGHRSVPLVPLATGTPVLGGSSPVHYLDDSMLPLSPIRAGHMEYIPKSILKQGVTDQINGDDGYLFCNVPEHHDLEDYIGELQESIKKLRLRLDKTMDHQEDLKIHEDRKTVKKLLNELEDRREELEGLDLAIERQKKNLSDMMHEEKVLKKQRKEAHSELNILRKKNDRKLFIRRRHLENEIFDEEIERSRIKYLFDELKCVEKTLAKRHAQLKDTERNLKERNAELKDTKEQTRDTFKRFDDANNNLHQALKEQQEIEKRSNDVAIELVKATEQLVVLKTDIKDLDRKKGRQERLLREINNIISKKDEEFKDIDGKVKITSEKLQRLQADLVINAEREKDMVQSLRDSEDVLVKRRSDIQKLKDQVEQSKQELEKLDQLIGRKKTELQLLQETNERKQLEFTNVLQEAESDITSKHRQMKECRDDLDNMNHQKVDLNNHIKTKKLELHQIKEEIQQEEEVLQRLINSVTKNKTELKHTLEMQKIEQTELENIKVQQTQKLSELERTQRALQDEKSELEQLNSEIARKSGDLERLRQAVDRDRLEVDQLTSEKQILDDQINVLTRDRDLLNENCKNLDEKLNTMKRNQRIMEEKITTINGRIEMVEAELRLREREMEDAVALKEDMQKELQSLKTAVNEKKHELKSLEDNIKHAEDQLKLIDKDVRNTFQHRDEVKLELEHLNEQLHISSNALEEHVRQEKTKYKELQDLLRTLADREKEHQETCLLLNKLKNEVENEETHLKRLVNNANSDLQHVRNELTAKIEELEILKAEFTELQKSSDELQFDKQKFLELSKTCQNLEKDLKNKLEETGELTKALSDTYETIEILQEENSKIKETLAKERIAFENTLKDLQGNLDQTKQEVKHVENRTSSQVSKLQSLAEKHFNRANILETELSQAKKEIFLTKQQPDRIFDNKENVSMTEVIIVPSVTQPVITSVADNHWTKDPLRKKITEEQEYLRYQLKQQMMRHSETMESARIKSEETVECLRKKLNALQQVLFDTYPSRRSRSSGCKIEFSDIKNRSRSPTEKTSFINRRARSSENIV